MKELGNTRRGLPSKVTILALLVWALGLAMPVHACYTVVVGKEVSATGNVLIAHNEDNLGPLTMPQYKVPRLSHGAGELLVFEEGTARIPQTAETGSYLWSETRHPSGASFSDFFLNEWGVAITSNNCDSRETAPELTEGGIGYGLRRIVAERARTAQEGLDLAIRLVEQYGYTGSGRSYQIADKNEVWILQIVHGKNYIARRLPDNEAAVIPNHYTIRTIDWTDTKNYRVSSSLVQHAIKQGWYEPAAPGDYSDFDFAKVYQTPEQYSKKNNVLRHKHGLDILLGQSTPAENFPFAVKPGQKVGTADIKRILRSHYEGTPDDLTDGYRKGSPHQWDNNAICAGLTQQSYIVQFQPEADFNRVWSAFGHPCTSVYVPWYFGITKVPEEFGWIDPQQGQRTHFHPPSDDVSYQPSRAWWAFQDLQNLAEPRYGLISPEIFAARDAMELQLEKEQPAVDEHAGRLYQQDPAKGREVLTEYTQRQARRSAALSREFIPRLQRGKLMILSGELHANDPSGLVAVALLSQPGFNVLEVEESSLKFGTPVLDFSKYGASPLQVSLKDLNQDGAPDLVIIFRTQVITKIDGPRYADLWLVGRTKDGQGFAAKDYITVNH